VDIRRDVHGLVGAKPGWRLSVCLRTPVLPLVGREALVSRVDQQSAGCYFTKKFTISYTIKNRLNAHILVWTAFSFRGALETRVDQQTAGCYFYKQK